MPPPLLIAILATGCENPKQAIGTVGGGALGAWAGSTIGKGRGNVVATAVGAVAGALAGGYIGGQLDQKDRMEADRAHQRALESTLSVKLLNGEIQTLETLGQLHPLELSKPARATLS